MLYAGYLLLVTCLGLFGRPAGAVETLRFYYYEHDLSWTDPSGHATGKLIALLDLFAERAGLHFDYQTGQWSRAQILLQRDALDGFVTVATPSRENFLAFVPTPIFAVELKIYHRAEDRRFTGLTQSSQLKGLTQLSLLGQGAEPIFDPDHHLQLRSVEAMIKMVQAGRGDYFVADAAMMRGQPDGILADPAPFLEKPVFRIAIRRDFPGSASLVNRLDEVVRAAHQSHEIEQILASAP